MTQIIEAYVEIREELTKNVFSKISDPNSFESFKFGGGGRPTYCLSLEQLLSILFGLSDVPLAQALAPPGPQVSLRGFQRVRPALTHAPSPSSAGTPRFLHPSCDEGFGPVGGLELRLSQLKQE
ncbi:hypothetical protein C8J57DRAFT_1476504 [Mycena rebaudengoi]|nr:hypothetical protein C8J57DRAFT_1476504 [Mycena rebaudengoi]